MPESEKQSIPKALIRIAGYHCNYKLSNVDKLMYIGDMQTFQKTIRRSYRSKFRLLYMRKAKDGYKELSEFEKKLAQVFETHYSKKNQIKLLRKPNMRSDDAYKLKSIADKYPSYVIRSLDKNMGTAILKKETWNESVRYTMANTDYFQEVDDSQFFEDDVCKQAIDDFIKITKTHRYFLSHVGQATEEMKSAKFSKHIGSFIGLLKYHKGIQPNGLWKVRIVVSHCRSVIKHLSRATSKLWRKMRFYLERNLHFITVLPDVTDLINDIHLVNLRIARENICIDDVRVVVADMADMYPMTKKAKIISNLRLAQAASQLTEKEISFMTESQEFINKYSFFKVGDQIFFQPDGAIIGSYDGGDVCDTVYYIDECRARDQIESLLYFKRYRDDIIFFLLDDNNDCNQQYVDDHPKNNRCLDILSAIYGTEAKFDIQVLDCTKNGIAFLDAWIRIDRIANKIRTSSYIKPNNNNEHSRPSSSVPRHVLKSIVCGASKRYIIINDTFESYEKFRNKLYQKRLLELGWSWHDIKRTSNKPSYRSRMQYIEEYVEKQRKKATQFLEDHEVIAMIDSPKMEEDEIILVKPAFNSCFDDPATISTRLKEAEELLPSRLKNLNRTIAYRGCPKISHYFNKSGL